MSLLYIDLLEDAENTVIGIYDYMNRHVTVMSYGDKEVDLTLFEKLARNFVPAYRREHVRNLTDVKDYINAYLEEDANNRFVTNNTAILNLLSMDHPNERFFLNDIVYSTPIDQIRFEEVNYNVRLNTLDDEYKAISKLYKSYERFLQIVSLDVMYLRGVDVIDRIFGMISDSEDNRYKTGVICDVFTKNLLPDLCRLEIECKKLDSPYTFYLALTGMNSFKIELHSGYNLKIDLQAAYCKSRMLAMERRKATW